MEEVASLCIKNRDGRKKEKVESEFFFFFFYNAFVRLKTVHRIAIVVVFWMDSNQERIYKHITPLSTVLTLIY